MIVRYLLNSPVKILPLIQSPCLLYANRSGARLSHRWRFFAQAGIHIFGKRSFHSNGSCQNDTELTEIYASFVHDYSDWTIHEEQLLLYWIYTYFCGAIYDDQIFAKAKMAVICTFMIHELAAGTWLK